MSNTKTNNNPKYVFAWVVGTAYRTRTFSLLAKQESIPCVIYHDPKTGLVNAYAADENGQATTNRIGRIIEQNDTAYSGDNGVAKTRAAFNDSMSADDFIEAFGDAHVAGTVIAKVLQNGNLVMVRVDEEVKSSAAKAEEKKVTVKPEPKIDLSMFSPEDAKQVQSRLDYIAKLSFPAAIRKNVQAAMVNWLSSHTGISEFKPVYINFDNKVETCVKNILIHKHLNFVGPKGAGKNKMTFHLSSLFDVDLFDLAFSYETSRGDTQGANNFDDNGKITFQLSGLAKAMQRRCVVVCDEANFARAAMLSDFHSALDFRRYMEITGYGKITLNEQCIFIITMNEGEGYEGTRPLNEAFRDRFHEVHFKSDPSQMPKVFMQECGLSEADANELAKLYKLIHQSVYQKNSTAYIPEEYLSQRKFINAGQLYASGFSASIKEAFEEEYLNTIGDPDIVETFKNLILINYK